VPVGAYATPSGDGLKLTAQVTSLDGTQRVFASAAGADAQLLGETLARTMLERGAEVILRQIRVTQRAAVGPAEQRVGRRHRAGG
jgi:hydroxymethylbilane synthase